MNALPDGLKNSAQVQLILNNVMYLVKYYDVANGSSLTDLLDSVAKHIADGSQPPLSETDLRAYEKIKAAVAQNPSLGKLTISHQSKVMGYPMNGLNAAVFTDEAGNVFVVFRGTGEGEWIDNGYGLSGLDEHWDTRQQLQALEYFDKVMADLEKDKDFAGKFANGEQFITVSGHSKGGNKAQYVTINSEYSDLIDKCFNFDGQGFSPEAIEHFIEENGQAAYAEAVNKMYGFNAENDYVNPLGIRVIPDEHMYYFTRTEGFFLNGIENHYPDAFLDESGNFSKQADGPGELSLLVRKMSDIIMSWPPETRSVVTESAMNICQKYLGKAEPIEGELSLGTFLKGLPLVLPVFIVAFWEVIGAPAVFEGIKGLLETVKNFGITIGYGFASLGTGLWDIITSFDVQKIFQGILKVLWGAVLILYSIIETGINLIIDIINLVINKVVEMINSLGRLTKAIGGIFDKEWGWHVDVLSPVEKLPLPSPSLWEAGGFPATGQSFVARESGPEIVGRLNGRTAVVNDQQIVEAVSLGVYGAVMSALNDTPSHSPAIARVFLDGRQIATAG